MLFILGFGWDQIKEIFSKWRILLNMRTLNKDFTVKKLTFIQT
jgi:hypothetical protein